MTESDFWAELPIPDTWTATWMLRNMVADNLGGGESLNGPLDDDTRNRMLGMAMIATLEIGAKLARLIEIVEALDADCRSGSG